MELFFNFISRAIHNVENVLLIRDLTAMVQLTMCKIIQGVNFIFGNWNLHVTFCNDKIN